MIGALALGFGGAEAGFVGFGGVRQRQICGVGDIVRDAVFGRSDRRLVSESRTLRRRQRLRDKFSRDDVGMADRAVIDASDAPQTRASIATDLRGLGVAPGCTLVVHTAVSRLGWCVVGPSPCTLQGLQSCHHNRTRRTG
jgi:hypothetical protein